MVWAVASSKPEEIHCWLRQWWALRASSLKFHRHSTTSLDWGNIPIRRNGLVRGSGSFENTMSTTSGDSAVVMDGMISPRLTALPLTRAETEYQLMRARVTPESFRDIHVPPFGSEG